MTATLTVGAGTLQVSEHASIGNRDFYRYSIHLDGVLVDEGTDLSTGTPQTEEDMLRTLCAFLVAAAEDEDMAEHHPAPVVQWAKQESDELNLASLDPEDEL